MVEEADQIRDGGVGDLVVERLSDRLQHPDAMLVLVGLEARDMVDGVFRGEFVGGPQTQPCFGSQALIVMRIGIAWMCQLRGLRTC
jgi:hypothetical protein